MRYPVPQQDELPVRDGAFGGGQGRGDVLLGSWGEHWGCGPGWRGSEKQGSPPRRSLLPGLLRLQPRLDDIALAWHLSSPVGVAMGTLVLCINIILLVQEVKTALSG